jgi:3-dehydroquinate dehydratase/shikimate dehydrogenase
MVLVTAPVSGPDAASILAASRTAQQAGADLVEWRLDVCLQAGATSADLIAAIPRSPLPVLATIRHMDEGGAWNGDEAQRHDLLVACDKAGAAYVDIEVSHVGDLRARITRAKLILSFHDFEGMGGDLPARIASMRAAGADVAKVAVRAGDAADLATIHDLYDTATGPLVALAMGEHGLASRLLAGAWGAHMTFARNDGDAGSAPGQPTVRELVGLYRVKEQNADTRVLGIIGSPVAHSLSPLIHNLALAHHRVNAVYVPFRCENPAAFWDACGTWISGLSVTIPHKQALIDRMAGVEELVQRVGAMNTIYRNREGQALGANTDAIAVAACLESVMGPLTGRRVLVLGAGGVARAIACAAQQGGAEVAITNRTMDKAHVLAEELGVRALLPDDAHLFQWDALINGTAQGMGEPEVSPWPAERLRRGAVVFDTVYHPLETRLLRDAQQASCRTISGLDMLIKQALGQFKRWTGLEAPEHLMLRAALDRLSATRA